MGHLFLVRGRIESVVHDAALVPTNDAFELEPQWRPVLETDDTSALRPPRWPGEGHGRAADGRPLWFVSVEDGGGLPTGQLVERAIACVRAAAEEDLPPLTNRLLPVLAVPVLGLEGGGHDEDRGDVVKALLEAMYDVVPDLELDVVVVTPESSVYAAAQHVRGRLETGTLEGHSEHAERLGRLAREGDLALFLGAGVSIPAGLPAWAEMLRLLGSRTGRLGEDEAVRLTPLDQAQLLERRVPDLGRYVAEIAGEATRPSLAHALLAGLSCREAVTTNYDRLYEEALVASGREDVRVLPHDPAVGARAWVLKLHGDVADPGSIVLTRRDFVRFDARTRPAGALLQTLLMTRHLLFVGASMTDDNVVRLAQEVQVYREDHGLDGRFGTLLDVDGDEPRRELWEGQLSWLTMPGERIEERVRALEIFLDTVAWHAADDAPWLLDPRFGGLLGEDEQAVAEAARELRRRLEDAGAEWTQLVAALDRLGGDL